MQEYLPTKKAQIYIAILVVVVVGVFVIDKVQRDQGGEGILSIIRSEQNIDSDGDGLADWEEELWLTHPFIADTDGDGTNDGDEVAMGRHPRIPAPNDELYEGEKERIYAKADSGYRDSLSASIIPQTRYNTLVIAHKRLEGDEDPQDPGRILEPLVAMADEVKTKKYTPEDVRVTTPMNPESVVAYFENLLNAIKAATKQLGNAEHESVVLIRYFNENRQEDLSKLSLYADSYETLVKQLLLIRVPQTFATLHLRVVNEFQTMSETLDILSSYESDPIKGFVAYDKYRFAAKESTNALNELGRSIGEYLKSQNQSL